MGRDALTVAVDFNVLNKLLGLAYDLGRENENREERGIPLLEPDEEFPKMVAQAIEDKYFA